ncbi:MAG: class I SAM-dependent methyltransferase [bacterium]
MDATAWIDALLAARGQELLRELATEPPTAQTEIRRITRLRERYPPELISAALEQHSLRARARAKFAHAERMLFTPAGLEQASSDRMARHHASRYASFDSMADLCTGIGGDLIGFAAERSVLAVDSNPVHARLSSYNASVNGVADRVTALCADVCDLRVTDLVKIGAAFVDPARRSDERRMRPGMSEPPLSWCFGLAERGVAVGVKAAPGLPTEVVPSGWELEFVSEHRELKASVLWSPTLATTRRRATLLPNQQTLIERPGAHVALGEPGSYLLDPDPAVTRAGLVEELGESLGSCWKIDPQIAFLTANHPMQTPFGRTLAIESSQPWGLAGLRNELRRLDVGVIDIRKRGSAVDVDEVQRRLKLTGGRKATVVLTRVADRPWMFVCSELAGGLDLNSMLV